jgi:integrase
VELREYANAWLVQRVGLRPRTVELYGSLLDNHILPELGSAHLSSLSTAGIRSWHSSLLRRSQPSSVTVAKCYRLLRTILATAVEDELIAKNPCVIKGASIEHSMERPIAGVTEIDRLAAAVPARYRAMILLGTYGGLRYGELAGLERQHIDVAAGAVTVVQQLQELSTGECCIGPPKTDAGRRSVTIPPYILIDVKWHMLRFVANGPTALVFTAPEGGPLRRSNFRRRVWEPARENVGLGQMHFHDLRHTGNTLAASTGASTKELMRRLGHASARAALIYQHATAERDAAIARNLCELALGRAINVPSSGLLGPVRSERKPVTRQNAGGDDGTRTHDPLRTNLGQLDPPGR